MTATVKKSNRSITQLIRYIAADTIEAEKPTNLVIATVTKVKPLKIKVGRSLILTENFLIKTSTFTSRNIKKGTKILCIRSWGGQRYALIDTID